MKNSKRRIIITTTTAATTKTTTTTRVSTNNDKNRNWFFLTPSQLRGSYLGDNSNKKNCDYNRTRKKDNKHEQYKQQTRTATTEQ